MRTYSRKRPVYQAIKGVSELCRLCLGRDEVSVPIFDDADQLCAALSLRIMICVGLEMTRDSDLPNAICVECYKQLEQCYTFRKKCEVTYQKLKAHVLAMKGRHLNPTAMKTTEAADSEPSPVESNEQEQLVLTYDEAQQMQLLNLVNSNSVQLDTTENIYDTATLEVLSNELEKSTCDEVNTITVDESIPNPSTTPLEIEESTSDLSLIMSTMLLELGVLGQEGEGLILADKDLRTVELEGADNTKVILQLVEEDEEEKDVPVEINKKTIEVEPLYTLTLLKEGIIKSNKPRQQASKTSKTSKEKGTKGDTTCRVCAKRFTSRSVLARHARVHSGARPHACATCGRRFAQRAVLKRHELVHREKRPFACTQCPKSFTQRGALEQHARKHAPPHARALALHSCPACDKVFLYASGLSRHMPVHTGRRYHCATCGRAYSDPSALRRHARRHHTLPGETTPPPPQD
ncbi:zinc finger protein 200-like [Ostrinia nubilalis]|uniref:zinc finger protein 200-like n=1 Tax=Ostrinia nubilalis TaxID=29057 RepID=UPI003082351C